MRAITRNEYMDHCRVLGCRYKGTHIWKDHRCGLCDEWGHGQMECGNDDLINNLKLYGKNDALKEELYCRSTDCPSKKNHTTASHLCNVCKSKGTEMSNCYHIAQECPEQKPKEEIMPHKIECPLCRTINEVNGDKLDKIFGIEGKCKICATNDIDFLLPKCKHCIMCLDCTRQIMISNPDYNNNSVNISTAGTQDYWDNMNNNIEQFTLSVMGTTPGKIYIKKYGGMGSCIYIKRDDVDQPLQQFMMYQDDWGQYGPETNKVPEMEAFLDGYVELTN